MGNNDKIIGLALAVIGALAILYEIIILFIIPLKDGPPFDSQLFWAMAIPILLGVVGVLGIVVWVGVTMIQTPPPESWDFDSLDESLDEEEGEGSDAKAKPEKKAGSDGSEIENLDGVTKTIFKTLMDNGYDTKAKLAAASVADLTSLKGIGKVSAEKIIQAAKE